ncbi:flagellar hook-length control protein FliK [Chelativorans sp. Marseille-P2723]|uniref:flagellar hook-length control protein FliK n=1 Tax=Chelativorans sp. Marseille-P2723 TaxID=2709133 RepID=UPI00156DC05E|nr:flagellar hook-length control protein FliK [Chelativorans sp. Marseille-P2723]
MTEAIKASIGPLAVSHDKPERRSIGQGSAFADALQEEPQQSGPNGGGKHMVKAPLTDGWPVTDRILESAVAWNRTIAKNDGGSGKKVENERLEAFQMAVSAVLAKDMEFPGEAWTGPFSGPSQMENDVPGSALLMANAERLDERVDLSPREAHVEGARRNERLPAAGRIEIQRDSLPLLERANAVDKKQGIAARGIEPDLASAFREPGKQATPISPKEPDLLPPATRVLSVQSIPAPAFLPTLSSSVSGTVLAALESDTTYRVAFAEAATAVAQNTRNPQPLLTLKIQLHPSELGTVMANLKMSGEQLTVELQVESTEARLKLQADRDSMVQALRSLGYDVDRISIQQMTNSPSATPGSTGSGRESSFQAGTGPGQDQNSGRPDSGAGDNPFAPSREAIEGRQDDASGDGIYI